MSQKPYPFSEEEIERLETWLFSDQCPEALDLIGIHGLVSGFTVAPGELPDAGALLTIVLGDEGQKASWGDSLNSDLKALHRHIHRQLMGEEGITLPEEVFEDDEAMAVWASCFMEAVYENEGIWFAPQREEAVASLLLPVMAHSGLFTDGEFKTIIQNDKLMADLADQIPETVLDMYLLFQAEPTK